MGKDDKADDPGALGTTAGDSGALGTPTVEELQKQLEAKTQEAARHAKRAERITALEAKVVELEGKLPKDKSKDDEGDPTHLPKSGDPEVARLNRELRELKESHEKGQKELAVEREERHKTAHRSAVRGFVSRANLPAPIDAEELLLGRTKLAKDGQTLTYSAKGQSGESEDVELTDDTFEKSKLLSPQFWPAKGKSGTGGTPPRELGGGPVGVDMERAANDPEYYAKNRDSIRAHRRKAASA